MSQLNEYKMWVGWCTNKAKNSDKVWSIILTDEQSRQRDWRQDGSPDFISGSYIVAYGRRGKTLQTKVHSYMSAHEVERLIDSKRRKGYKLIPPAELNDVYPEFEDDLDWVQVEGKILA